MNHATQLSCTFSNSRRVSHWNNHQPRLVATTTTTTTSSFFRGGSCMYPPLPPLDPPLSSVRIACNMQGMQGVTRFKESCEGPIESQAVTSSNQQATSNKQQSRARRRRRRRRRLSSNRINDHLTQSCLVSLVSSLTHDVLLYACMQGQADGLDRPWGGTG